MKSLVKMLIGLLVGVLVAPSVGVDPLRYLASVGVCVAIALLAGFVAGVLLLLRAGSGVDMDPLFSALAFALILAVDRRFGFTLDQILVLTLASLAVRFATEMIWPTMEKRQAFRPGAG